MMWGKIRLVVYEFELRGSGATRYGATSVVPSASVWLSLQWNTKNYLPLLSPSSRFMYIFAGVHCRRVQSSDL